MRLPCGDEVTAVDVACQVCGNDDATQHLCMDCLEQPESTVPVQQLAEQLVTLRQNLDGRLRTVEEHMRAAGRDLAARDLITDARLMLVEGSVPPVDLPAAEFKRASEQLEQIRHLHCGDREELYCQHCHRPWPCPTYRAAEVK